MKYSQSQKGSITLWLIIASVIMVVIVGYILFVKQNRGQNNQSLSQIKSGITDIKTLDCGTYVTSGDVSRTLGLSSHVIVTVETSVATSCRISWMVPPLSPSIKSISKGSALFILGKSTDTDMMFAALCKNKSISAGISCYTDKTATSNSGLIFKKANVLVQVTQTSAQTVTQQQLNALAQAIAIKL